MEWELMGNMVEALAENLKAKGWWLATAESCTGGLISSELTNAPGSSTWFTGGLVAYSNKIKQEMLDVPGEVLTANGAVSRETVLAMARGAARRFSTQCALAVSGIAGPDGGTPEKPVGTVWIAWCVNGQATAELFQFGGGRLDVKRQSAMEAVMGMAARTG
jgi:nicotinamide-nucleotide amidase